MATKPLTINAADELQRLDPAAYEALPAELRKLVEAAKWTIDVHPGERMTRNGEIEMRIAIRPNKAARELERRAAEGRAD